MASDEQIAGTPKNTQVGPYSYRIDFESEESYEWTYLGITHNRTRRIGLDPRQSNTEVPQTFLHEVLHALGSVYEIKEWRAHKYTTDQKLDDQIDLMASALLVWMRNNPDQVSWLIENRS